jgi:transcriptional regulator with XRE-family HTH domain
MTAVVSTIGRRIRAARFAAGFTQVELAAAIKKHPNTVRLLERDAYSPTVDLIDSIALACGVNRLDLIPESTPELQAV